MSKPQFEWSEAGVTYLSYSVKVDQYELKFGRLLSPYTRLLYNGNEVSLDEKNFFCFTVPEGGEEDNLMEALL